ncbi:MarR family transcriptional regulator [Bacillus haynesii]|uniref:MarR family transcriptional regulator n=1 Tax=Bacillus haynesii TaxID=1925021 RepID=UPI00228011B3|nr:MarR family transcriptional regulator [Bacillus haynesii]MCY7862648.1 MarR family transcriptional regulator [Bacillus haynesii]MCY8344578.1 MarR family transcriptional regulator [Bacillus haynesii]MCY8558148.1 MarR family transcriptional regulator [Bacillus haynesii]
MILKIKRQASRLNRSPHLRQEEHDTLSKLKRMPIESLNLEAISVATNLYRSAQKLRVKMETEVLSSYQLSWTAFSILYDLWVWGRLETKKLAELSGISTATASNVIKTLEKKNFCVKSADPRDRRHVFAEITPEGKAAIEELYPAFHKGETMLIKGMTKEEQNTLIELLRKTNDNLHQS